MASFFSMYPYPLEVNRLKARKAYLADLIKKEQNAPEPRPHYIEILMEAEARTRDLLAAYAVIVSYETQLP